MYLKRQKLDVALHSLQINGYDIETEGLYLMDISYINSEFRKNHARQVDGVLGTDFLDKYEAVMLSFVVPDLNVYAVGLQL